ncbi:putative CoA-binding protein [Thermanaerovibrio velox DSM 12556]|uniref:Putative CoA-binding protein n=1 Tax=Thermanaerovibrio velox DSM 12556 TaxID=926567 RepID=H0USM6_9BACT|nr:CoA-binding protein [Thermanaerovibrio velox]EHM10315.1 putative CoA-binding protein [Thermanaerovibrio velox DSM 12556]
MSSKMESVISSARRVAIVGASAKEDRMSNRVHKYLKSKGFEVYPVNPSIKGEKVNGDVCLGDVSALPEDVDVVALFLSPANQREVIESLGRTKGRPAVFFQPGAENPEGEEALRTLGFEVFEGCVMAVHRSLSGGTL